MRHRAIAKYGTIERLKEQRDSVINRCLDL